MRYYGKDPAQLTPGLTDLVWTGPELPAVVATLPLKTLRLQGLEGADLSALVGLSQLEDLTIATAGRVRLKLPELALPLLTSFSARGIESMAGLQGCPELRQLRLSKHRMKVLPWAEHPRLRVLSVVEGPLYKLPDLSGLPALETLRVSENKLTALHPSIAKLPNLRVLDARLNGLSKVPFRVDHLARVDLSGNPLVAPVAGMIRPDQTSVSLEKMGLAALPDEVRGCTDLRSLHLGRNGLTTLPDWVGEFQLLELIELHENPLEELPVALFLAPKLRSVSLGKTAFSDRRRDVEGLLKALVGRDEHTRRAWHALLTDRPVELATEVLMDALGASPAVRVAAEGRLRSLPSPFDQPFSSVQTSGKLGLGKTELKKRLKEQGVKVVTSEGDILVLGAKPKPVAHPRVGLESQLKDWLMACEGAPTLMSGGVKAPEALTDMVRNEDPEVVLQALELMELAGLPTQLVTDVYVVAIGHEDPKLRKKASKLYARYAPAELQSGTPTRSWQGHSDDHMTKMLHKMVGSGLDVGVLAAQVFARTGRGRAFCGDGAVHFEGRAALLLRVAHRSRVRYAGGGLGDVYKQARLYLDHMGLKSVAPEVGQIEGLRTLDIYGNKLTAVPPLLHSIGELRVNYNTRLKALPEGIQVKELNVGYTAIKQLPTSVFEGLEQLHINGCKSLNLKSLFASLQAAPQFKRLWAARCPALGKKPELLEGFQAARPDVEVRV